MSSAATLRKAIGKHAAWVTPTAVLLGALSLYVAQVPILEDLRLGAFDRFQRLQPRAYQDVPIRIVDLDDETLSRLGQWPWPRTQVADLVSRLRELGATTVAFDIVFAEPDRTSPSNILTLWPDTPELGAVRDLLEQLPEHDRVFAQAIGRANVVTGYVFTPEPNAQQPGKKFGMSFRGDDPRPHIATFNGAITNLPLLEAAASGNGHFNPWPDRDGIIRRVPLLLRLGDTLYPSLVLEALRVDQGASTYIVTSSGASREEGFGEHTGLVSVKIGNLVVPTDAQGRAWLYYTAPIPERTIPAWQVLEGSADREALAGHIVFVGTSAAGLKDQRATPLNPMVAGVEIHAQLAEQILAQQFLERPDWAKGAELVYLFVLGVALILLLPRVGALWCAVLGGAAIVAAYGFSWYAFTRLHWLLDPAYPSLVALVIYFVSSLISFLRTEVERRHVRDAFSRYLSPALVDRVANHPERLVLGGEIRPMSLLFADIRGFTTIAEQLNAQELTRFINKFLTPMTRVILERQGTIDKYMGDCIMAFWNAPLDDPQHARHACEAALAMGEALRIRNDELRETGRQLGKSEIEIRIGIGINTGDCCVGNMGSDQRFDYSVLGDDVNLASRLEGQSKHYGVMTVIGERTQQQAQDFATLELDVVTVRGKTKPVRIFTLLGDQRLRDSAPFQALLEQHECLIQAYRAQRWEEARALADACLALQVDGVALRGLYELYALRVDFYRHTPPGEEWDGVFVARSK